MNKCKCGTYTDYGTTCVNCALREGEARDELLDFEIEDLIEREEPPE